MDSLLNYALGGPTGPPVQHGAKTGASVSGDEKVFFPPPSGGATSSGTSSAAANSVANTTNTTNVDTTGFGTAAFPSSGESSKVAVGSSKRASPRLAARGRGPLPTGDDFAPTLSPVVDLRGQEQDGFSSKADAANAGVLPKSQPVYEVSARTAAMRAATQPEAAPRVQEPAAPEVADDAPGAASSAAGNSSFSAISSNEDPLASAEAYMKNFYASSDVYNYAATSAVDVTTSYNAATSSYSFTPSSAAVMSDDSAMVLSSGVEGASSTSAAGGGTGDPPPTAFSPNKPRGGGSDDLRKELKTLVRGRQNFNTRKHSPTSTEGGAFAEGGGRAPALDRLPDPNDHVHPATTRGSVSTNGLDSKYDAALRRLHGQDAEITPDAGGPPPGITGTPAASPTSAKPVAGKSSWASWFTRRG